MKKQPWEKLETKSNKLQDQLIELVPKKDRKKSNILLLDIIDLEITLERKYM